jgi:hypothetical protein
MILVTVVDASVGTGVGNEVGGYEVGYGVGMRVAIVQYLFQISLNARVSYYQFITQLLTETDSLTLLHRVMKILILW